MTQYLIIEVQNRDDGINNIQEIVARNSLASGLAYFYDRCSKMSATTLYPSVNIELKDTDGNIIKNEKLTTAYEPAEPAE